MNDVARYSIKVNRWNFTHTFNTFNYFKPLNYFKGNKADSCFTARHVCEAVRQDKDQLLRRRQLL